VAGDNRLIVAGDCTADAALRSTSDSLAVADATAVGAPRGSAPGSASWHAGRDHPRARVAVTAARPAAGPAQLSPALTPRGAGVAAEPAAPAGSRRGGGLR
jgi:hypothetical protein